MTKVSISFGVSAWKEFRAQVPKGSPDDLDSRKFTAKLWNFIYERLNSKLKEHGFGKDSRGLAFFENALDYQIDFAIGTIGQCLRIGKLPKRLNFDIDLSRAHEVDTLELD